METGRYPCFALLNFLEEITVSKFLINILLCKTQPNGAEHFPLLKVPGNFYAISP